MLKTSLLRARHGDQDTRVGFIELFFDLVFVFAVGQLSHGLLEHLDGAGAIRTLILFLAVWWVWACTTWATNYLSTDHLLVRFLLFVLMLLGLVMSISIPHAFDERGLSFGLAVATMQVSRTVFLTLCIRAHPAQFRNFRRVTIWFAIAGTFWIAGGLAEPSDRLWLWTIAISAETLPAFFGFRLPGLGRSHPRDWNVSAAHMAERCGLFVIIALGEMIIIAGATFAGLAWAPAESVAVLAGIIAAIAMWWIYFNIGAERATRFFENLQEPGALARTGYTYLHMPIVAGVVVMAVAIELALAHPLGHSEPEMVATASGAAILFLGGNLLFKRVAGGWLQLSHLVGLAGAAALFAFGHLLAPAFLLAAVASLLALVAAWETISLSTAE